MFVPFFRITINDMGGVEMKEVVVAVGATAGLHARPASMLVKKAAEFTSKISIQKGDKVADGKRLLSILTLSAKQGEKVTVRVEGTDEEEAITAIKALIESNC